MQTAFGQISSKLNEFINRFYSIAALRGTILFFSLFSFLLVTLSLGVYLLDAGTNFRTGVALLLVLLGVFQFIYWVIVPLLRRSGLVKRMTYLQAAEIIDDLNHTIGEKLINGIELNELLAADNELIAAGIDQITLELNVFKPIGFVRLERLKQAFWTILPFALIFLFTLSTGKFSDLLEGSERLISFRTEYLPKDYIKFELLSASEVTEGEDYQIKYKLTTSYLPNEVTILVDDVEVSTLKADGLVYEARVRNAFNSFSVECKAGRYSSGLTDVSIVRIAKIKNYFFKVLPPAYSRLESQTINGVNVITVPENSEVIWNGRIVNSDEVVWKIGEQERVVENSENENLTLKARVKNNQVWEVLNNESLALSAYELNVVKDRYPTIVQRLFKDSTSENRFFISGTLQDDYGISSLKLVLEINGKRVVEKQRISSAKSQEFLIEYTPKDDAKVWLEVRDNDNYNGYKLTKSQVLSIDVKSQKSIINESSAKQKELQKNLKKEIDEARKSEDRESDNTKKNNLEDSEKSFEEMLQISEEFKKQLQRDKQSDLYNEEILAKQEEIEKRMAELDEDLRKLLEDLQRLQEELAQDQKLEEEIEMSKEDVLDELDRMADLLERLQFEKELENLINEVDEIQKKQEELANEKEGDAEEQKELNKQFNEAKKKLEELNKKSKDVNANEMQIVDKENVEDIEEEMKSSEENQEKGKQKKANESQKKAAEKLDKLKKQLSDAQSAMSSSAQSENMEDLRKLLQNILVLSDGEEDLLESYRTIKTDNPIYNENMTQQGQFKVDYKIIKDSLTALMHRTPAIENVVLKDMNAIDRYFEKSTNSLKNNKLNVAVGEMHYVMTSLNNLALLLNQNLDNMQSRMKGNKPGDKSCNKPGGSKPGLGELRKMQKQLGKDAEGMEKGGKKPGEKGEGSFGKGENGKKMSQMMGRQEMIRMQLQKLREEKGLGDKGFDDIEELMRKNEEDLANKYLGSEFFERQKEIETKMLESEKALMEREQDDKRESEFSDDEYERVKREARDAYLQKSLKGLERIQWDKLLLSPFYQNKLQNESQDRD